MKTTKISFIKHNGRKKYSLVLSDREEPRTVFQQFVLSLPIDVQLEKLETYSMSEYKYPTKSRLSFNGLWQIFADNNAVLKKNIKTINKWVIAKDELGDKYFKVSLPLKNAYLNILQKAEPKKDQIQIDNSANAQKVAANIDDLVLEMNAFKQQYLNDKKSQQDFDKLENKVSDLVTRFHSLTNGLNGLNKVNQASTVENYKLKTKMAKQETIAKQEKTLIKFLQDNYALYLQNDSSRADFIVNLLNSRNQPQVQQMINHSYHNLFALVNAVTKIGDK